MAKKKAKKESTDKSTDSEKKLDLKKHVKDIEGNPVLDESELVYFKRPVEVSVDGDIFEDVHLLQRQADKLTFRKAIQNALLFNPGQQENDVPAIEKRTGLALKLTADTSVSFTNSEVGYITKCAKAYYSRPGQQSIIYLRILELVDPEEFKKVTS